jgi:hypothetical protein
MSAAEHVAIKHDNCNETHCPVCDGGLFICARCGLIEGSLTSECPGVESWCENGDAIYNGYRDFRGGAWVAEVSPHCPAGIRQAVDKYKAERDQKREISDREWSAQPANLREGCSVHVQGVGDL